ncbi:MFS transporter [Xanthomonas hortorum pv. vitians]|uniref:MFS transporter n=2 Tax=Xanthomonas hortorum TaxID=56454 RepID=A0A6V7EDE6_9XANT|nr:MFS transporter [Xanthomonas hortorum]MCC4625563.1 MFS transporter [Xanthomonas campestris pv. nigromaculans]APP81011.1 MFS transporter [Xanthomonas hortorum pv. gardneri]ASW44954.1 MFS transporter permease [Xanthomonas hortorum]EGD20338.1 arabinose efflux permease family protein [Xanthomonas hortorum ATCC 19865]KLA90607.1 MFS transporter permease [Xanthomonas hortorum pv. gardneri]
MKTDPSPGTAPATQLTRGDYKTLALSALGGALELYDFIIFIFFATVLGELFFPPGIPDWMRQLQTFGIFAAGYLIRPLGGIVMAHFGDLLGRKRMFALSIGLMALPTLAIGVLPTYAQIGLAAPLLLLTMRLLQGAAIGGEVPSAWVFVAEHVPAQRRGLACGTLTAGLAAGVLLGSLSAGAINRAFTPQEIADYAWRLPFLAGGVFGLLSVYLRRWLHETPVFAELMAMRAVARETPLKVVLRDHPRSVALSLWLTWMVAAGVLVVSLMTPTLLQSVYRYPAAVALQANLLAVLLQAIGSIVAGALSDRWGNGRVLLVGSVFLGMSAWLFYRLAGDPQLLFPLYALLGAALGVLGAIPRIMVEAFPPVVRLSGVSFAYNLGYAVFGGLTPLVVVMLLKQHPMGPAYYMILLAVIGGVIGLQLWRRERASRY